MHAMDQSLAISRFRGRIQTIGVKRTGIARQLRKNVDIAIGDESTETAGHSNVDLFVGQVQILVYEDGLGDHASNESDSLCT